MIIKKLALSRISRTHANCNNSPLMLLNPSALASLAHARITTLMEMVNNDTLRSHLTYARELQPYIYMR